MLELVVSPAMGKAVSRGALAMKEREVPKGAGLLWARNGARPVGVGPREIDYQASASWFPRTCIDLRGGLEVLRY